MKTRGWCRALGTLALIKSTTPLTAAADEPSFLVNPSISFAAVFDDNIFGTASGREHDFISRISPAIEAEYRGPQLTLQGGYIQDAEFFLDHSELDSLKARMHGIARAQYRSTPQLTFGLETSYTETERPNDLNVVTGVAGARARTQRFFAGPSMAYQFTPAFRATLGYNFSQDDVKNGIDTETRTTDLNLSYRFTARNTGLFNYEHQEFHFSSFDEPVKAHVVMVGDTHAFTERTSATVIAGSRFTEESPLSEESTDLELRTQLRQLFETGEYTASYAKSQSTAINVVGLVETHTFGLTAIYFPERTLEFRVSPEYGKSKSTLSGREADGFRINADVTKHLDRTWSIIGGYQRTEQEGSLNGIGGDRVVRNILMVGIVYAPLALAKDGTMLLDDRTKLRDGLLPRMDIRP